MIDAQRKESSAQTDKKGVSDRVSINPSDTSQFVSHGALRGIDEEFAASSAVALGLSPQLSLSHSRAVDWLLGQSRSWLCSSIARPTESSMLRYKVADEAYVFNPSGAEEPIPITGPIEELCACVDPWTGKEDTDTEWGSITKKPLTWLCKTARSNIAERSGISQILTWLTYESFGDKGNFSLYRYRAEDSGEDDLYQPSELESLEHCNQRPNNLKT